LFFRRIIRGIRTGEFFWDLYYAIKFYLLPATGTQYKICLLCQDRWIQYDFKKKPPKPANYQIVRKSQLRKEDKTRLKKPIATQL
jgi:hypothetical protein